ncbi:MAG TPA: efflux RND transporter permease subunit, partial [Pirellulales bacterium]
MRTIVAWACRNSPAVNVLLISLLIVGAMSLSMMRREVFPEFQLEIVLVTVPYPGASPGEVEDGICQKIEEAVRSLAGVKKMTSIAKEGAGNVVLEIEPSVKDVQKIVNEVRSEVERIPSFPDLAERPEVTQITLREPALFVGLMGPNDDSPAGRLRLREVAESIRQDLLQLPDVSQANLMGVPDYQVDVEISEQTLRKHGLSLRDVAAVVRRENLELPGGTMKTDADEVLLRAKNKQIEGRQIAKLPLVTQPNGSVLTVGDLGRVRDEFIDSTFISRINGRPAIAISVDRTADEDLLRIADQVHTFVTNKTPPEGFELTIWADRSVDVRDRIDMLVSNGVQGGVLVFILLALFLEFRLAFWVSLGIPVSLLGAGAVLLYFDQTLNMLSLFAFLLTIGIVVDDAIVVGENVYAHSERGEAPMDAAINGTVEVIPSVFASVVTTVIAFVPLMYISGVMGKFIGVMPITVIAMLVISLIESLTSLPAHLAHNDDDWLTQTRAGVKRMPFLLRWTVGWLIMAAVDVLLLLWWCVLPVMWLFQ